MLNSNKPIKFVHLQKLTNQAMLNGAKASIVDNFFYESKKKNGSEKYILKLYWISYNIESN